MASPTPDELYDAYSEHAKTLRTWLVAYGIGAPVVLLSNDRVWTALVEFGAARCVGILFLSGVVVQVLLAVVNKNAMWACYWAALNPEAKDKAAFKLADRLSASFWIDIAADLLSLALFIAATVILFDVLVGG